MAATEVGAPCLGGGGTVSSEPVSGWRVNYEEPTSKQNTNFGGDRRSHE